MRFLFARALIVLKKRVLICIDRQHCVALMPLARCISEFVPQTCNAQRHAVYVGKACSHGTSAPPVGSSTASTGMMQCCPRRQALPKVNDFAAVSGRAMNVERFFSFGQIVSACA